MGELINEDNDLTDSNILICNELPLSIRPYYSYDIEINELL